MVERSYQLAADAPNAIDDMREMLEGLPIDPDDISSIHISVTAEAKPESLMDALEQTRLEEFDEPIEHTFDESVEYGPVPESERPNRPGSGGTGGGRYKGTRAADAVMPDTKHARALNCIQDVWLTSREVAEKLGIDQNTASAYLSSAFNDHGYAKRRNDVPYEYTLDSNGKTALELGRRLYEEELEDEEVLG